MPLAVGHGGLEVRPPTEQENVAGAPVNRHCLAGGRTRMYL